MGKFVPASKGIAYPPKTIPPAPGEVDPAAPAPDQKAAGAKPRPHPHLDGVLKQTELRTGPTDYDPQFCSDVVAVMGEGFSLTAFAGTINVSRQDVDAWIAVHPDFAAAVERGRAARTRELETQFLTAGTGAKVAAQVFALKNAAPQDWREHPDAETAKREAATIVFVSNDRGDDLAKRAGRDVG